MAKKNAEVKSIPAIYQGLNRDTSLLKACIVEDVHGQFFIYQHDKTINIVKQAQQKVWANFDKFAEENKQTLLAYHENLFDQSADKDQSIVETASWCWYKIASVCVNKDAYAYIATPKTAGGRSSEILTRKYFYGDNDNPEHTNTGELKTPQALACLRLFRRGILERGETTGEPGSEIRHITEGTMKTFIVENAAELKTRQDPWRIFQYYRPNLLKERLLKHD